MLQRHQTEVLVLRELSPNSHRSPSSDIEAPADHDYLLKTLDPAASEVMLVKELNKRYPIFKALLGFKASYKEIRKSYGIIRKLDRYS